MSVIEFFSGESAWGDQCACFRLQVECLRPRLRTDRLVLRGQTGEDADAVAVLWAYPCVVRFIGGTPDDTTAAWSRPLRQIGHWTVTGCGH